MKKLIALAAFLFAMAILIESCGPPRDANRIRKKKGPMGWM